MNTFEGISVNDINLIVFNDGTILKYKTNEWIKATENITNNRYIKIYIGGKVYAWHRIVAMAFHGLDLTNRCQVVDHINRNTKDNNKDNLRVVSQYVNSLNTSKESKGFYWHQQSQRYRASIRVETKSIHLGNFKTPQEARNAYIEAKLRYHQIKLKVN